MPNLKKTDTGWSGEKDRGSCPPPDDFVRAFLGEIPIERKFRLLDHIAFCSECEREFQGLLELWREKPEKLNALDMRPGEMEQVARKRLEAMKENRRLRTGSLPSLWRIAPYFASAAALIAVAVMMIPLLTRHPAPDMVREASSGKINFISPVGEVLRAPFLFRWTPVQEADGYTLDILDDALLPVMTIPRITDAEYALTPGEAAKLERGRSYFWKVTADLHDLRMLESGIGRFTLPDD